ncbi:MAG TPA: PHP domain-containing protein [Candidatus Hydrogenedentes bacterium]|jgi:hypothetical protein|nr:PHP domain-containing protein [Candidatus Hydrogenedentota bacterium]MDY0030529.1 PHP domain-containing protein [FCB group bacterium]NLT60024.1 hypothetical protein [Candidatus Hydrogenedentota bacterium]HNV22950.1 PHP domain-containing protein [Candidatus Hydrogenedentota bacterium]HNZ18226.1 PHP domain-containing protein [Candidatus Hydrogenedentota bacterium]
MIDKLPGAGFPGTTKVETHAHTAKYSVCSRIPPRELIAMADASGYDALFLTEHDRVWSKSEIAGLQELAERVRLFPGIEITLTDEVHVLVLGAHEPVYERLKTPSDVFGQACVDGFLTVVAHPFRWSSVLPEYCRLADAVEVLTCNHGLEDHAAAARAYARAQHMAELHASDAHGLNFMNKFWLETSEPFDSPQEFRRLILAGRYANHTREFEMPLPPPEKVASMSDLTEEDQLALWVQPTL